MGHSSLDLTMKVYTDLSLLDGEGAVEALPELGLERKAESSVASHRGGERREASRAGLTCAVADVRLTRGFQPGGTVLPQVVGNAPVR
jgi:hypothetical protein